MVPYEAGSLASSSNAEPSSSSSFFVHRGVNPVKSSRPFDARYEGSTLERFFKAICVVVEHCVEEFIEVLRPALLFHSLFEDGEFPDFLEYDAHFVPEAEFIEELVVSASRLNINVVVDE